MALRSTRRSRLALLRGAHANVLGTRLSGALRRCQRLDFLARARGRLSLDHFLRILFFLLGFLGFLSFTLLAVVVLLCVALRTETVFGRPVAMGLARIGGSAEGASSASWKIF